MDVLVVDDRNGWNVRKIRYVRFGDFKFDAIGTGRESSVTVGSTDKDNVILIIIQILNFIGVIGCGADSSPCYSPFLLFFCLARSFSPADSLSYARLRLLLLFARSFSLAGLLSYARLKLLL